MILILLWLIEVPNGSLTCEKANRICYTMELDEKYASVILRRYVEDTGDAENVFVIRNGERLAYSDLVKEVEGADGENNLTLGSLFDGSGGFPLGGLISGITPVWASEIEPFPIRVTTKRQPQVKNYGDISKMNGADLEPVDIITFGSPCQDMSIAGKRDGLSGSRSSLFYEAVRIIKEMRCKKMDKNKDLSCGKMSPEHSAPTR